MKRTETVEQKLSSVQWKRTPHSRGGEHARPSGWKEQGEQTDGLVLPVMAQAFHYKAFGSSSPRSFQLKHRVSPE